MRAVLERQAAHAQQVDEDFIDHRRGLQSVVRPLVAQVGLRDGMQVIVDQRGQGLDCAGFPLLPARQELSDLPLPGFRHTSS